MTIHVNIGEAKTRLSELVAAAVRGEQVILDKAGVPTARIVPLEKEPVADESDTIRARRMRAFGMYRHLITGEVPLVRDLKPTEEEIEERYRRKFGPAD